MNSPIASWKIISLQLDRLRLVDLCCQDPKVSFICSCQVIRYKEHRCKWASNSELRNALEVRRYLNIQIQHILIYFTSWEELTHQRLSVLVYCCNIASYGSPCPKAHVNCYLHAIVSVVTFPKTPCY